MKDSNRDIMAFIRERVVPTGRSRHGLVIGIEQYRDARLNLRCAKADAKAIYNLMIDPECGAFPKENVTLLLDSEATRDQIWKALSSLRRNTCERDTVWVYYAGHAAPEDSNLYWVTYDSNVDDLYGTGLSDEQIRRVLDDIRVSRLLVLLDCCHAAATAAKKNPTRGVLTAEDVFSCYKGKGRITIASSDGKEKSVEITEVGHGAFTYFLEKGLRGEADCDNEGVVTADKLWQYLRSKVTEASQKAGNRQTPVLTGQLTHDLALSLNPMAAQQKKRLADKIAASVGFGEGWLTTQEAELCMRLLRYGARNESEQDIHEEIIAFVEGRTEIATFRRLLRGQLSLEESLPFDKKNQLKDRLESIAQTESLPLEPTLSIISCPKCRSRFEVSPEELSHAKRLRCSSCKHIFPTPAAKSRLYVKSAMTLDEAVAAVSTEKEKQYFINQAEEWKDWDYFIKEMIMVSWRTGNELQNAAFTINEQLESIGENDKNDAIASTVFRAIHSVHLPPFDQMLSDFSQSLVDTIVELVEDMPADIIKRYPQYKSFQRGFLIPDPIKAKLISEMSNALSILKSDYDTLVDRHNQLMESFPRYQKIITRSTWSSFFTGAGLGAIFGAPLAIIGTVLWEDWKGKGDEEFLQYYSNAIDDFMNFCGELTSRGELAIADQCDLIDLIFEAAYRKFRAIHVALAKQGVDLEAMDKQLEQDQKEMLAGDEIGREFIEVVLENLKQDKHMPRKSLRNIEKHLKSIGIGIE